MQARRYEQLIALVAYLSLVVPSSVLGEGTHAGISDSQTSGSKEPRAEGEGQTPAGKQKEQEQKQRDEAVSDLKLNKEKATEVSGLFPQISDAQAEITKDKSSDQEANAKLIPLFKKLTDSLSEEQVKNIGSNDKLLSALGVSGEDKSKQKELLLKVAEERARFIGIWKSSMYGKNFTTQGKGNCAGVECSRWMADTAKTKNGSESAADAINSFYKSKTLPEKIRLSNGTEVPLRSNEAAKALAEVLQPREVEWLNSEIAKYLKDKSLPNFDEMKKQIAIKSLSEMQQMAELPATKDSGLSIWLNSSFPKQDDSGKPVIKPDGKPETVTAEHAITLFSTGVGDYKTLVVRDPNFPGLGQNISLDSNGALSYDIKDETGTPLKAYWQVAFPSPPLWKR